MSIEEKAWNLRIEIAADPTMTKALEILKRHDIEVKEENGKVYALECVMDGQTWQYTETWKEVEVKDRKIKVGGMNLSYWLGY